MIVLLTIIFVITLPNQNNYLKSDLVSQLTESNTVTNTLLLMMSTEIPALKSNLEGNDIAPSSLSTLLFKVTSGITPRNFSSLMEGELPGLKSYARGVNVSKTGDVAADMPIESPPPDFENLLKEDADKSKNDPPKSDDDTNGQGPEQVFIYHSHAWEAFLPLMDNKKKPSEASSTDNKKNVFYVGSMLADALKKDGVNAAHDKTNVTEGLHAKGWNYYDSYNFSRETVEKVMADNKSLNYFIDIHRDSQRKDVTTATINEKPYAKVFFTVGVVHKDYKKNLQFAEELNKKIEEKYPGISRGIFKKDKSEGNGVYNQDLSGNSILIEVGGVDNDDEELQNTADALADVLSQYIKNAEKVDG
ncbi:stage II sporulation protein P [Lentibacillus sp. N15]